MDEISDPCPEEAGLLKMHQEMLSRALRSYWANLNTSMTVRRYLKERGVTAESVQRFGLGYAEAGPQALRSVFPNYQVQALVDCGLVLEGTRGRYDRFRDRLIFPILNESGRVIAFGGRTMDDQGPKYLNSPQTALFDKGATLFGLAQARPSIETTGEVIVVEGYMDVVMSAQNGVSNIVATLGTATTATHVQKLMSCGARRIVFCFDGDDAGRKAAVSAMDACVEVINPSTAEVAFTFLPGGEDPDSLVRKHGAEVFKGYIANALTFETFLLDNLRNGKDLGTCEGRAHLASDALEILARIRDAGMFYRLCEAVARDAGFTVAEMIDLSGSQQQRIWHSATSAPQVQALSSAEESVAASDGKLKIA